MTSTSWHEKYRPKTLDDVVGHKNVVTQLRGMLKTKVPGALLFLGPPSVGKTTFARVLAAEVNGKPVEEQSDFVEINGGEARTIEDMRSLIGISKFKPTNKKRFIVLDEAQQILSNAVAAAALLAPIEKAGRTDTIWILCSMDPAKFASDKNGKALATRCTQFILEPPTNADLYAQGKKIRAAEKMKYVSDELLKEVVKKSNQEMRTLANLLQNAANLYSGSGELPTIDDVIKTQTTADDELLITVVVSALTGQYKMVHRALLDVQDGFQFLNKLMYAAEFLLSNQVVEGRHSKVWWTPINKTLVDKLKSSKVTVGQYAAFLEMAVKTKQEAASFSVGETQLASTKIFRFIKDNFSKE